MTKTTESDSSPTGTKKARQTSASGAKRTTSTTKKKPKNAGTDAVDFSTEDFTKVSSAPKTGRKSLAMPAASLLFQAPDLSSFSAKSDPEEKPARASRARNTDNDNQAPTEPARTARRRTRTHAEASQEDNSSSSHEGNDTSANKTSGAKNVAKGRNNAPASKSKSEAVEEESSTTRRRRRRTRSDEGEGNGVQSLEGSTRLEAKRIRRKAGRKESRKHQPITESEFLARRENVKREMVVREKNGLNQVAVLEDGLLVEHYVSRHTQTTMVGNVYLGKVQNVLSSMEAAFVDIGKGRNAVLYAGEVNWDAAGLNAKTGRIEDALNPGDLVLVQVTKDPIGHKGARLTSQITLAGRHLVLVPSGAMTGISRKLSDSERKRLKTLLKSMIPAGYGVIVRTAAEGATEEQLRSDVQRLTKIWQDIETKREKAKNGPLLLHGEPELAVRVVRDVFNEDFQSLTIQGDEAFKTISKYVQDLSPELKNRLKHWTGEDDVFAAHRVDEQLAKGFERKVWLPSGGYLIIDRTEAMTVIDVNTGRYIGTGGTLEETVTKNNLEAAEEIVRQLRLRDIGGIVVIDFVDMVIESNRDLVLRRLVECLGRDRTRHQVTEVTSLGLVQMTRKRVGQGLVEAFSTTCECCEGRGFIVHDVPVENNGQAPEDVVKHTASRRSNGGSSKRSRQAKPKAVKETKPEVRQKMAGIAAAAHVHEESSEDQELETIKLNDFETGDTPAPAASLPELTSAADRLVISAASSRLEIAAKEVASSQRRRHRRAASTGVVSTDSDEPDIVVSED